jgi:hypothetical protein
MIFTNINDIKPGMIIKQYTKDKESVWFKLVTHVTNDEVWGYSQTLESYDTPFDREKFNKDQSRFSGFLTFRYNNFELVKDIKSWKRLIK